MDGSYVYLPLATLQTIQAACVACLTDNFTAHQSYSIAGRNITRANVGQVSEILKEVSFAISYLTGAAPTTSEADMSNGDTSRRRGWVG